MNINIRGMTDAIRKIGAHYEHTRKKLDNTYLKIVRDLGEEIRASAVAKLNKPSWRLSSAIASKQKLYHDGEYVFGITGTQRANRKKNDPGVYGFYHEQGYFLSLDKVKKKNKRKIRKKRIKLDNGRKKSVAYAYEHTKGRHFFRSAFKSIKSRFVKSIRDANLLFEAEIHKNMGQK